MVRIAPGRPLRPLAGPLRVRYEEFPIRFQKPKSREEFERISRQDHPYRRIHAKKMLAILDRDLLVGGFPCQDYSVARVLSQAAGLIGKKGVLWWSIHELLSRYQPRFVLLENVDRLLNSPANQRGRDFAIMLASLAQLGYRVEWRIVNAADYGFPQRRRRVFIVGERTEEGFDAPMGSILDDGILARALPVTATNSERPRDGSVRSFTLDDRLDVVSDAVAVLLSALSYVGARDADAAGKAFAMGADRAGLSNLKRRPVQEARLTSLDQALDQLAKLTPPAKRTLIHAAAATVAADGKITAGEAELLRAVADTLACPMPPLLSDDGLMT